MALWLTGDAVVAAGVAAGAQAGGVFMAEDDAAPQGGAGVALFARAVGAGQVARALTGDVEVLAGMTAVTAAGDVVVGEVDLGPDAAAAMTHIAA